LTIGSSQKCLLQTSSNILRWGSFFLSTFPSQSNAPSSRLPVQMPHSATSATSISRLEAAQVTKGCHRVDLCESVWICVYVCTCICAYVCMCVYVCMRAWVIIWYIYIYTYICIYIHIYIYICIHVHTIIFFVRCPALNHDIVGFFPVPWPRSCRSVGFTVEIHGHVSKTCVENPLGILPNLKSIIAINL